MYDYYSGRNEELNAELDKIIDGSQPYAEGKAKELFLRHVLNPGAEKMEKMRECGVEVVESPAEIGAAVEKILGA